MRLVKAITGLFMLLGGSGVMAAPQLEYLVNVVNDSAGIRSDRHVWELRDSLGRFFNYRIAATDQSGFQYKDEDWTVHNLTTDSRSIAVVLDWHPLAGSVRISSGLMLHKQTLNYVVAPDVDETFRYEINYDSQESPTELADRVAEYGYTIEDLEPYLPVDSQKISINRHIKINPKDIAAHARVNYKLPAPYFGMGWSSPFFNNNRLRYSFDIGVLYQIEPDIEMIIQGDLVDTAKPATVTWLNEWTLEQKQEMHEKLDKNKLSPRLGFGLSYRLY